MPGDLREKVDPYLRPIFDALNDMLPADQLLERLGTGEIEVAPIAFMRGRTLSRAFVILDEAQNTTPVQMKMFLTRLGEGSRMVVTGDPTQIDLPAGTRSGLAEALEALHGVEGIASCASPSGTSCATRSSPASCAPTRRANAQHAPPNRRESTSTVGDRSRLALRRRGSAYCPDADDRVPRARRAAAPWRAAWRRSASHRGSVELAVSLADDAEQQQLNRDWRGIDPPTNVLAFPAWAPARRSRPARRCCSATSCSLSRRWRARQRSRTSRWPTISLI